MSDEASRVGIIAWTDLTVPDAEVVRDFYQDVVGWEHEAVNMPGGYSDFTMTEPEDGGAVAGVCHARGANADLPAQWLIYINVDDLDRSMSRTEELGGEVISPPRSLGPNGRYCVIKDPVGAVAALVEPIKTTDEGA